MARRMIGTEVYNDDRFTDLPIQARLLYTYLILNGDDDGFLSNVKSVLFSAGAGKEDLQKLIDSGYIIKFDTGVYVIKHWRLMNTIKKDRYKPTIHVNEYSMLKPLDNNKVYEILCVHSGNKTETEWKQKSSQVKSSKNNIRKTNFDDIDAVSNGEHEKTVLFFSEENYKEVKNQFTEKIGTLRNMEEWKMLKELTETYGVEFVSMCIDKAAAKKAKTIQYVKKVCDSSNVEK